MNEYGYGYAGLVLSVVNHDAFSGKVANEFFVRVANIERARSGLPELTNSELAEVSLRLMAADLNARTFADRYTEDGSQLNVTAVQNYHEEVFRVFGVSIAAWTPAFALETLNSVGAREELWSSYLSGGGNDLTVLAAFGSYNGIPGAIANGPAPYDGEAYLSLLTNAGARSAFGSSHEYGDYSVGLGRVIQGASGLVLGGTEDDDALGSAIVTGGVGSTDVIMGFDGDDGLQGLAGADTLYGGRGDDTLYASGEDDWQDDTQADDSLRGGAGRDELYLGGGDQGRGGADDDTIFLSTASFDEAARVDGGAGWDILTLRDSEDDLTVEVVAETNEDEEFSDDANGYTFVIGTQGGRASHRGTGFEALATGEGADTIDLRGADDEQDFIIHAGDGDNEVWGGDGDDVLLMGMGDDTVNGGAGRDVLISLTSFQEVPEGWSGRRAESIDTELEGGDGQDLYVVNLGSLAGEDRRSYGVDISDDDGSGEIVLLFEIDGVWETENLSDFTPSVEQYTGTIEGITISVEMTTFTSDGSPMYFSFLYNQTDVVDFSRPAPADNTIYPWSTGSATGEGVWTIVLRQAVNGVDDVAQLVIDGDRDDDDIVVGVLYLLDLPVEGFAVGGSSVVTTEIDGTYAALSGIGEEPIVIALDDPDHIPGQDVPSNTKIGGDGDDEIVGGFRDNRIAGGGGADYLEGGAGDDILYGDGAPSEWGLA